MEKLLNKYRFLEEDKKLKHPNPQFYRENWHALDGEWNFEFDDRDEGIVEKWFLEKKCWNYSINVPYAYQSEKSGIYNLESEASYDVSYNGIQHNVVWYSRKFQYTKLKEKNLILNFGAVDYETKIWINGNYIGDHKGGFTPFNFEIKNYLENGENTITIRVEDNNLCSQPIGKQSWKNENFLCWYTRTVGIWQSVWLEEVGNYRIKEFKMETLVEQSSLKLDVYFTGDREYSYKKSRNLRLEAEIFFSNEEIRKVSGTIVDNRIQFLVDVSSKNPNFRVNYWTPNTPNLYNLKLYVKSEDITLDVVETYFGMRKIEVINGKIALNSLDFYQKLILDQGYYHKGLMTGTVEEFKKDLVAVKEMGFNGVRKHQKIADNRYMYLCDKLGLVMWAEMPSIFQYSNESFQNMVRETQEMVKKHWNHPSVIVYTLMNESWGINEVYNNIDEQNMVKALYYLVKGMDNTRLIIGNDGWEHVKTDILAIHDYNSNPETLFNSWKDKNIAVTGTPSLTSLRQNYVKNYEYSGEPVIISEYGGVAYSEKNTNKNSWGYGERASSKEEVFKRFKELTESVMKIDYLSGFCYTQLTDVEQEINGLLDNEHNLKFELKEIKNILESKKNNGYIFK